MPTAAANMKRLEGSRRHRAGEIGLMGQPPSGEINLDARYSGVPRIASRNRRAVRSPVTADSLIASATARRIAADSA